MGVQGLWLSRAVRLWTHCSVQECGELNEEAPCTEQVSITLFFNKIIKKIGFNMTLVIFYSSATLLLETFIYMQIARLPAWLVVQILFKHLSLQAAPQKPNPNLNSG